MIRGCAPPSSRTPPTPPPTAPPIAAPLPLEPPGAGAGAPCPLVLPDDGAVPSFTDAGACVGPAPSDDEPVVAGAGAGSAGPGDAVAGEGPLAIGGGDVIGGGGAGGGDVIGGGGEWLAFGLGAASGLGALTGSKAPVDPLMLTPEGVLSGCAATGRGPAQRVTTSRAGARIRMALVILPVAPCML